MDAPKKFPVEDFLEAIKQMRRTFDIKVTDVPTSKVLHRAMDLFLAPWLRTLHVQTLGNSWVPEEGVVLAMPHLQHIYLIHE